MPCKGKYEIKIKGMYKMYISFFANEKNETFLKRQAGNTINQRKRDYFLKNKNQLFALRISIISLPISTPAIKACSATASDFSLANSNSSIALINSALSFSSRSSSSFGIY